MTTSGAWKSYAVALVVLVVAAALLVAGGIMYAVRTVELNHDAREVRP